MFLCTHIHIHMHTHFYIVNYQYILKLMSFHYLLKFQSNTFNSNATFYLFLFPYFIQNLAPISTITFHLFAQSQDVQRVSELLVCTSAKQEFNICSDLCLF